MKRPRKSKAALARACKAVDKKPPMHMCVHEAAHAHAVYTFGGQFEEVTVIQQGDIGGRIKGVEGLSHDNAITMDLAGPIAQAKAARTSTLCFVIIQSLEKHPESDLAKAKASLAIVTNHDLALAEVFKRPTLTRTLDDHCKSAARYVRIHWSEIKAIALKLQVQRIMTYSEVKAIIDAMQPAAPSDVAEVA